MSGRFSAALQAAVHARLVGDVALSELVDGIFDAPPPGVLAGTLVLIGEDEVIDRSDLAGGGAEHRLQLAVVSEATGFLAAKAAAARIEALLEAGTAEIDAALPGATVVAIWFDTMRARRLEGGRLRRVELRFRVRIAW